MAINILQWITVPAPLNMFLWQILGPVEIMIFLLTIYFVQVFITGKNISVAKQFILFLLFLPTLVYLPTALNIDHFEISLCEGVSGNLWKYIYLVEVVSIAWITQIWLNAYYLQNKKSRKNLIFGIAATSLLLIFSASNIYAESLGIYEINLIGPVGLLIFLGLLTFIIVKYRTFNIKIIGTQALVATLWVLIGSLLFVARSELTRIIVAVTEIIAVIFGVILIKSVKREVTQREKIEKLASALAETNDELNIANDKLKELDKQKTEFVSVASHQLRAPTTAIKGYSSMLLEGSYGPLEEKAKQAVDVIFQSAQKLNFVIEDFLNITRIELGKMKYEITEVDLKKMVEQVFKELDPVAKRKGLDFSFSAGRGSFKVMADPSKLSQVIMNIVDNSIKYTPSGSIKARLEVKDGKRRFSITDTGVGMSEETKGRLFQKFTRAYNASASNGTGTGLGLFVAKQMIEAQGGRMWVESPGEGKGSTFFVEL